MALLDPVPQRDVLEEPVPVDAGLLALLDPVPQRDVLEEPVPVDAGLLYVDADEP